MDLYDLVRPSRDIDAGVSDALLACNAQTLLERAVSTLGHIRPRLPEPSRMDRCLELLLELPKDYQYPLALHPSFSFWLAAVRRFSNDDRSDAELGRLVDQVGTLVLAPALAAGRTFEHPIPVILDAHGGLRCPGYGRYLEFGEDHANAQATAELESGTAHLSFEDGWAMHVPADDLTDPAVPQPLPTLEEHGYTTTEFPRVGDGRVEVYNRDPWLRVQLSGTNQRDTGAVFDAEDVDNYPPDFDLPILELAVGEVKETWREQYDDLTKFTRVIVPIRAGMTGGRAFTVSSRQGAIFVGIQGVQATIEMALHENAHVKLRRIQEIDLLMKDWHEDSKRFSVPWRKDKRPLPGILEGTYVFAHVCDFLLRQLQAGRASGDSGQERIAGLLRDLSYAVGLIRQHAELTSAGEQFIAGMGQWVEAINAELHAAAPA